ncbi:MAG: fibronectin type III domain-containing protein, partial [Candidatus Latescibacteria bacterium]|nr:fibronectin type III domain-containing protein [Candidatus Latescibacterota bacterium]
KTRKAASPLRLKRSPRVQSGTSVASVQISLNKPATVTVGYDDVAVGGYALSASSTQASTNHEIPLTDLTSNTRHNYRVTATAGDQTITSRNFKFRTKRQSPPPSITRGPSARPASQGVFINWKTNVATTGRVFVGTIGAGGTLGTSDEFEKTDGLKRGHSVKFDGLTRGTAYGYRIEGEDINGQTYIFDPLNSKSGKPVSAKQVVGNDGGFGTNEVDDTQFPLITRGPTIVNATESTLTIEWDTDEFATAAVNYGTAADALDDIEINGTPSTTQRVTLTGLAAGTTYFYQIGATDISDNGPAQSQVALGTTLSEPDITAPAFSTAPTASYTADTRADIQWVTNELSSAEISYGLSATNLDLFEEITDLAAAQAITLTNLTAGTTYFYQISATDLDGNGPTQSEVLSFTTLTTPDIEAPTIADVVVAATDSAAVITWTTSEVANSNVQFGISADALSNSIADIDAVTAHRIVLANLTPETTYTYIVQSSDPVGNGPTSSTQATFTTVAAGTATAPAAPEGLAARAGNGAVQLTWTTPEATAIGLILERAEGEGDFTSLATLDPSTAYIDNTVVNGTAYSYRITAQGLFQRTGTPSTATAAVTPATDAGPTAPSLSGIQGEPLTPTIIVNNSSPANEGDALTYSFQISTQEDYSDVVDVATVASGDGKTSYTVATELTDGSKYFYRVKSNDGFSDSPFFSGSFTVNASASPYPGDFDGDLIVG